MHSPPGQYAELLSTLVIRTLLQKLQDVHGSVEVATGQADADRRFVFVPCQYPYFDPCQPQSLDGLLDFVLESERDKGEKEYIPCAHVTCTVYTKLPVIPIYNNIMSMRR